MQINLHESDPRVSQLVERVVAGEEIIIGSENGEPLAKLIPYEETPTQKPRRGGQWKGRVKIADDFDELPKEIAEAFGMESK